MLLGVVVLDLLGQPTAADVVLVGTIVFMLPSALSGLADYSETTGTPLTRATLHATLMVVALLRADRVARHARRRARRPDRARSRCRSSGSSS